jgi:hypothetical protein
LAQVHDRAFRLLIYLAHDGNLVASFVVIPLVNASGIYPKQS